MPKHCVQAQGHARLMWNRMLDVLPRHAVCLCVKVSDMTFHCGDAE